MLFLSKKNIFLLAMYKSRQYFCVDPIRSINFRQNNFVSKREICSDSLRPRRPVFAVEVRTVYFNATKLTSTEHAVTCTEIYSSYFGGENATCDTLYSPGPIGGMSAEQSVNVLDSGYY